MEQIFATSAGQRVDALVEGQSVAVPAHFDSEVFAMIRRSLRRRLVTRERAELALLRLAQLDAERRPLTPLLAAAFAARDPFGAYDVFYVVLARQLGGTLVTADRPLARAAAGYVEVSLVSG